MKRAVLRYYTYFPIVGLVGFLVLFVIATTLYPGGSLYDMNAKGHSYIHNYICDLMSLNLPEGTVNRARPYAVVAHLLLSFGMVSFFYILPEIFDRWNTNTRLVRILGMLTMTIFVFMYSSYHDTVVFITGIIGCAALIPFFIELYSYQRYKGMQVLAYICAILSILVFISYETKIGSYYTPLLQKITFVFDAIWVIWVSIIVSSKHRNDPDKAFKAFQAGKI